MTCAETRRQLPAPEPPVAADVEAHLSECGPCRAECDALREVDRRVQRLGQARRDGMPLALRDLDQLLAAQLSAALPASSQPAAALSLGTLRRAQLFRALGAALMISVCAALLVLGLTLLMRGF